MLAWQGFAYGRSEPADAEGAREVQLRVKASCGAVDLSHAAVHAAPFCCGLFTNLAGAGRSRNLFRLRCSGLRMCLDQSQGQIARTESFVQAILVPTQHGDEEFMLLCACSTALQIGTWNVTLRHFFPWIPGLQEAEPHGREMRGQDVA